MLGAGWGGRLCPGSFHTPRGGLIRPGLPLLPLMPGPGCLRIGGRTKPFSSLGGRNGGQSQGQGWGENSNGASCCPGALDPVCSPAGPFPWGASWASKPGRWGAGDSPYQEVMPPGRAGRPWWAQASGPGAVPRLHWAQGAGGAGAGSILWPCRPGVPGLGDQGRGKGIFFQEELEVGC